VERVRERRAGLPHRRRDRRGAAQHRRRARPRLAEGVALTAARRPKDRKATIVDAAAELFAARGFAAVGIDDIGAEVGVTGPAIYRHYAGKDAVLAAVLERAASALAELCDDVTASDAPGDAVEQLARGSVRITLDQPALLATYLRERGRLSRDDTRALAAVERRLARAWLAAMRSVRPEVDDVRALVRRQAAVGAVTTGARNHRDVDRPRVDDVLVASVVGIVTAPVAHDGDAPVAVVPDERQAPASKRDEILAAALTLFRARGVSGVGVDEIGASAGISGPTLYHYYDSKAAIVLDAFDRAGERVAADVDEALRGAGSAGDALDRLVRSYVSVAADNVDLIVVTSREGAALPRRERPRLSRRRRVVRDGWTAALRGVRPDLTEAEARLLVRCTFPLVNHAVEAAEGHDGLEAEVVAVTLAHLHQK
jgi:AcrR family transcriptional regulator